MKNKFLTYFVNRIAYFVCCLTFFCISAVSANAQNYISQQRIKKIVIDAGHGGKDPGTVGKKSKEKDITLAVALKLGELINKNFPEIDVIYTRKKDVFIELSERGNIANRNNADLFISIHVDAIKNNPRVGGASTWVMGSHKSQANLEVSLRENNVITMEDDYTSKYQGYDPKSPESYIIFLLMQNAHLTESVKIANIVQNEMVANGPIKGDRGVRQAGFLVLWKTAMPSILIELGFLSNPTEEEILNKSENQAKIAQNIFSALSKYKQEYETVSDTAASAQIIDNAEPEKDEVKIIDEEKNNSDSLPPKTEDKTAENKTSTNNTRTSQKTYSVQVMAITKKIPTTSKNFNGLKNVKCIKSGQYYKYITGSFKELNEAKRLSKSLQKDFKGAFVVEVDGNNLTAVR
ncbi:MAG: N-acetylmuramoyl-L-alanine amidase [Prevotellaceae bacterium]|jgi:N-acetylmuramoyl-L-alanine amidase|nr:N-acetylmuramoyl-L-alanine amidase [Prevotellaceae bacterium]